VLTPVIHNLVEAFRSCSEMSHLPQATLLLSLMAVAAALLAITLLRSRVRR
jgi:hypothetical protein